MKKLLTTLLTILICFSLTACKDDEASEQSVKQEETTQETTVKEDTKQEEATTVEETKDETTEEATKEETVVEESKETDRTNLYYWVNFRNIDGSTLQRTTYKYGSTPAYNGETPTYYDGSYIYTFTGWNKKISTVHMTQIYTAVYSKVAIANNKSKQVVKDTCADVFGVAYAWEDNGWYKINVYQNGVSYCIGGTSDRVKPTGYNGEGWYHIDENWLIIEKCNKSSELNIKLAHDLIYYPEVVEDLVYDGTEHDLVYAGEGTTFKYSVEHEGTVTQTGEDVPTATDAGDYIVRYSIDNGTTWSEGINVSIARRDVTIASTTDSKTYDGTPLKRNEAGDAYPVEGSLGTGDTFSVTMDASITNVGSVTNEIEDVLFLDVYGKDVSNNYHVTKQEGTLTITPALVNLPVIADITYDGGDHDIEADYENSLYDFVDGTKQATDAGIYNVVVSLKDANNYAWNLDTPISSDQTITWKITKRNVTLTSGDLTKIYDGNPLQTAYPTVGGDGFVSGQDLDWASTASITEVGSTQATFIVKKVIDNFNDEADVTDNYNITCNYGTLTITEASNLCDRHVTHCKVTSILGNKVIIDLYSWSEGENKFIKTGDQKTTDEDFNSSPEANKWYYANVGKWTSCNGIHD